jgi:hypothetical protein
MRIADQDIAAIQAFGYTEVEARFLYVVATHSGYFAPRQFVAFSGVKWGKRSTKFGEKLESRGHACWREYHDAGRVYHLFSKALYASIAKENLRNRRQHATEFIQTRLVLLDFILANQHCNYLETEQDKVRYFCEEQGLLKKCLPTKVYKGTLGAEPTLRYFVDKYPLFLDSSRPSSSVVTFSYVDPGQSSIKGFATHLNAYHPLFSQLDQFRFLYISGSVANFLRAERYFSEGVSADLSSDISSEILRYFRLRKAWDQKKYALFSNNEIEWLNNATKRFHGDRFEGLYAQWFSGELGADAVRGEFAQAGPRPKAEFATYLVGEHRLPPEATMSGGEVDFTPELHRKIFVASPSR